MYDPIAIKKCLIVMSMVMFYYLDCGVPGTKSDINGTTLLK